MFVVIVASHPASHIRLRAMITVLHRDAEHRGEGRDDHLSSPGGGVLGIYIGGGVPWHTKKGGY